MMHQIEKNGKIYLIETGYGFNVEKSEVRVYEGVDKFMRLINGVFVFRGTWDECIEYVESL